MTLEERLLNDFKQAMKDKDSVKSSTLSFLRAQMSYAALEKKKNVLDEAEGLAVIKKLIKQHQDSIAQFSRGERQDLVEKETRELEILKAYLPPEMPAEELARLIDGVIAQLQAGGMKDMGRVIKEVTARAAGAADSKLVSDLVRQRLSAARENT